MKTLLVHLDMATFVEKDLAILQSAHEVRSIHFRGLKDLSALWTGVQWCDLTFSWFGTIHALFAVLFSKVLSKKSVVVSGGYDVARTPRLREYGPLSKWHKRYGVLFVFANADLILCVSEFNRHETIENARARPSRTRLVYHGFDSDLFRPPRTGPKNNLAVTVAHIDPLSLRLKGLDLFAKSAAYLPEVRFVVVGPHKSDAAMASLRRIAPANLTFAGALYGDDLAKQLSSAHVYVQPSMRESFGCAVAEAMLCECVPVVSRQGALPEVVGDCGVYVDLEPDSVAQGIRRALERGADLGAQARRRVKALFPLEQRRLQLLTLIQEL